MKRSIYLIAFILFLFSCKKDATLQENATLADLAVSAKSMLTTLRQPGDTIIQLDSTKFPKKPKNLKSLASGDIYTDLYELNGINFFIQSKDAFQGNNTLQSQGKGQEVLLAPYSSTNANQLFRLRFLPASTGIPYLIYSAAQDAPIGAGSYASDPNRYVLYTQAASSTSLFGFSWDFSRNTTNDSFYFINQDIIGSGGGSPWDIFNYYLNATNGAIGFARSNNAITQQFNIVPNDTFTLESIEYINDPTAVLTQIPDFTTNWTYTNGSSIQQSMSTSFGERAKRTSSFTNQTSISTKLSTTVEVKVPFFANGKINTELSGSLQNTYGKTEEKEDTRTYDVPLLVPAHSRITATATVTRYNMNVNYIATLRGQNTSKLIKVRGVWSGVDCTDIIINTQQVDLRTNVVTKGASIKVSNR
ncbi:hypothetical protein AAKU52_003365 [Pedobacter sp. CG_S7]|uniref:ETX/MTX2 family pore-forming toxin n=1 Tax=Pedobacter sp. CG_S7 TaxID=3143930 RepID=UPI0033995974